MGKDCAMDRVYMTFDGGSGSINWLILRGVKGPVRLAKSEWRGVMTSVSDVPGPGEQEGGEKRELRF